MKKYQYVVLNQCVDDDAHNGYMFSVTYNNGLEIEFFGKSIKSELANFYFIFKDEEIISVVFDNDLIIETIYGKYCLLKIFSINVVKPANIN